VEEAGRRLGRLDILVNNAAQPFRKPAFELTPDDVERAFRVNFLPCVWSSLAAIPWMLRAGGGAIVNVSSFASRVVPTFESVYAATKCAMNGFSEGLRNELVEAGIHVALVHPGPIDTEIWERGEQPAGYRGPKHPPEIVARAILDAIETRRDEVYAPRFSPSLLTARLLRAVAPRLLYRGVRRMDPIPREIIEAARERARAARDESEAPAPCPTDSCGAPSRTCGSMESSGTSSSAATRPNPSARGRRRASSPGST